MSAVIGATHVLCAIGSGTDQVWASARAGIARIGNSHVMDKHFEPIQMGLVPEDGLGPLTPEIDALPLPSRARRMLRLVAFDGERTAMRAPLHFRMHEHTLNVAVPPRKEGHVAA